MNTNSQRQNISGTFANTDRLSSLPDDILLNILSLAPTKYAASTSIMSKRWRDLFLGVSRIDVTVQNTCRSDYEGLVKRILMSTSSPIDEFRFRIKCRIISASSIYTWITSLVRRGIKVVEIEQATPSLPPLYLPSVSPPPPKNQLPAKKFQSKTLVVLKFKGGTLTFDSNESVMFPNLKVFSLDSSRMFLKSKLLRFDDQSYPLLEDLSLSDLIPLNNHDQETIEISSNTLIRLKITGLDLNIFTRIDVDTPRLQHLRCKEQMISFRNCETLESAVLTIFGSQASIETLSSINSVKALHIDPKHIPEEFKAHVHSLPEFPNLNHLVFKFELDPPAMSEDLFWALLHRAPKLRELEFNMTEKMLPSKVVPLWFGQNLERINLSSFKGTDADVTMVEWMLHQAAMLHKIVLDSTHTGGVVKDTKVSTINRLVKLGQLRPRCEIVII